MADLNSQFGNAQASLDALESAGLLERERLESYRELDSGIELAQPVTLTEGQATAVKSIEASLDGFAPHLLQGITASGKTEVYLRLIRTVLDRGGSALLLVPEISLTHQVIARLRGRFADEVAVLHSELSAGERWDQWRRIVRGQARVAVGARSAVMAPLDKLSLIIVDEEHDPSYKQDDGVRYNARDVAVVRARDSNCPVILGSATPSLESWSHARNSRYSHLLLPERATTQALPRMEVVDLRGRDICATGGLSEHLAEQMRVNHQDGNQTLLFFNRRGYASSMQCYECGEIIECPNCSVGMTLHATRAQLRCHHCDMQRSKPDTCPTCNRDALVSQGLGTQRLEATVHELLPQARVARLDRDAAQRKGMTRSIIEDWQDGSIDVLIGTQMITKGHDVRGVTLVGVIQADSALSVPDFRASERTYALLTQVAGRAGRGQQRGRVIVQTYQPDNPAIAAAVRHDFEGFAGPELEARNELGYPPLQRMVLMRFEAIDRGAAENAAAAAARAVGGLDCRVRGPVPALVERLKSRYRFKLQLQGPNGALLRHAAVVARNAVAEQARRGRIRVLIDVDPLDVL